MGATVTPIRANSIKTAHLQNGAVTPAKLAKPIGDAVYTSGSSSSGTPGTLIAELEAAASHELVGLSMLMQNGAVSSGVSVVLTYTDDTTESVDPASNAGIWSVYAGGAIGGLSGSATYEFTGPAGGKKIKKATVNTRLTGTSARKAWLSAWNKPL